MNANTSLEILLPQLVYHVDELRRGAPAYTRLVTAANQRLTEAVDGWQRVSAKLEAQLKPTEPDNNC